MPGQTVRVPGGATLAFDEPVVKRTAVKYGRAIAFALELAAHFRRAAEARGLDHEIETRIDETDPQAYADVLALHFARHLEPLRAGIAAAG